MATSTILTLIGVAMSIAAHFIPKRKLNGSTPAPNNSNSNSNSSSSPTDRFNGLPGIPGHPFANRIFDRLFRKRQEADASHELVELVMSDPVTRAIFEERIKQGQ